MRGFVVIGLSTRKHVADGLLRRYRARMAATTTLKVAPATRERINDRAKAEGLTTGTFVPVACEDIESGREKSMIRPANS